jgi:hypothetical protein
MATWTDSFLVTLGSCSRCISIMIRRTARATTLCLALSILAGCADVIDTAAIDKLPGDRLIAPGERVGPISLWSTIDNAEAVLGQPAWMLPHKSCWGDDCYNFNKYGWPQYGLTLFVSQSDPHAKISQINVWNGATQWHTASGVSTATPFKQALDRINESIDIRYRSFCDNGGCAGYDADGMWIRSDNRNGPLTDLAIYDADWSMSGGRNALGNVPPRNANAMTK